MSWANKMILFAMAAGAASAVSGCGGDLGSCDESVLAAPDGGPYAGQEIVHRSCAGGLCHSQDATGDLRNGAPAGLDFDLVPPSSTVPDVTKVVHSSEVVREWREEMWDQIESGDMPPAGFGTLSAADKETVRNWLACGAPVEAVPTVVGADDDWTAIYGVFELRCLACHAEGRAAAGEGFELGMPGNACGALANLVNAPATTATCGGNGMLVVPGNPDASLLLQKLAQPVPSCGQQMPLASEPLTSEQLALIRTWIANGAQPPPECP